MEIRRFYCEKITKPVCELSGREAHHLASVLRLKKGERAELFDGRGFVALAVIKDISDKKVSLEIANIQTAQQRTSRRIIIAVSIAKGERFDWLVEKCTELGVDRISPVIFERTVKFATGSKAIQRWRNLSVSAAKQSGLNFLPALDSPAPLINVINSLKAIYPSLDILLGQPDLQATAVIQYSFSDSDVVVLIGPEGGVTAEELQICLEAGSKPVRLTGSILRVETAAIAFASILSAKRSS